MSRREQKFKHSFQDTLNSICNCGEDTENTSHYLLHCLDFLHERKDPLEHSQLYCSQYFLILIMTSLLKSFCMVKKILIVLIIQAY